MIRVYVHAIGISAPGLPNWSQAKSVLTGASAYQATEPPPYQPTLLPPNERRRVTPSIRQAFRAGEDALASYRGDPSGLSAVFASSDADLGIIHRICSALTTPARAVSPTDFHNSVHNAAAGYWSIATAARRSSTTLSAYDESFAAGLLEAALTVAEGDTLLVAYDVPGPAPIASTRPFGCAASVALVLGANRREESLAALALQCRPGQAEASLAPPLEALRLSNPALRALPLLANLANPGAGAVTLPLPGQMRLDVTIEP